MLSRINSVFLRTISVFRRLYRYWINVFSGKRCIYLKALRVWSWWFNSWRHLCRRMIWWMSRCIFLLYIWTSVIMCWCSRLIITLRLVLIPNILCSSDLILIISDALVLGRVVILFLMILIGLWSHSLYGVIIFFVWIVHYAICWSQRCPYLTTSIGWWVVSWCHIGWWRWWWGTGVGTLLLLCSIMIPGWSTCSYWF